MSPQRFTIYTWTRQGLLSLVKQSQRHTTTKHSAAGFRIAVWVPWGLRPPTPVTLGPAHHGWAQDQIQLTLYYITVYRGASVHLPAPARRQPHGLERLEVLRIGVCCTVRVCFCETERMRCRRMQGAGRARTHRQAGRLTSKILWKASEIDQ